MKNIIITGASRGIGYELAKLHLQKGNRVLALARSKSKLEELKKHQGKGSYQYLVLDLSNSLEYSNILHSIINWKNVDVLYNNAGYLVNKPFIDITEEDLTQSWNVNFKAPFQLIQTLLSKLKSTSHIVNISTMGAIQGSVKFAGLSAYSSSKSATINLTELLAEEFKDNGPKINAVALGAVQTEMLEEAFPGYQAPIKPNQMAEYLYEFGINGHQFQNGKTVQLSLTTP